MTKKLPVDKVRKFDSTKNGDALRLVEEHRDKEKHLFPLRIDEKTVIFVSEEKCTEKYRLEWMKKYRKGGKIDV